MSEREVVAFALWYQANIGGDKGCSEIEQHYQKWRELSKDSSQYWYIKAANLLMKVSPSSNG